MSPEKLLPLKTKKSDLFFDIWTLLFLMVMLDWRLSKKQNPHLTAAKELLGQIEKETKQL